MAAMFDRASCPHRSPNRLPVRPERRIVKLRFTRRWGPHHIAAYLHLARSTVEAVLYGMPLLRYLIKTRACRCVGPSRDATSDPTRVICASGRQQAGAHS